MTAWRRYNFYPFEEWFSITRGAGVYAVYCDGVLIYIGQSADVLKRLESYKMNYGFSNGRIYTPWGFCKDLYVKVRSARRMGEHLMIEARMIARLKPKFNCVGGNRQRNTPIDRYTSVHDQL